MREARARFSRRRFLGGTAAAAVASVAQPLAAGASSQLPTPALPLDALRPDGPLDEAYWRKVRSQFNIVDGLTFMNNGTFGPIPQVVLDENARIAREVASNPVDNYRTPDMDARRPALAAFVGADPDEITYTRSTTEGMALFALGVDWREGDEVLMCTHEHQGGFETYYTLEKRWGIKIRWVDIPSPAESVDELVSIYEKAINPKTRAIMVSHVTWVAGVTMPVKELSELAHRKGLLITVDGAHPVGMMDCDFHDLGCDHYAAAGQKWLMAGTGTGLAYFKRDILDSVWPIMGSGGSSNDVWPLANRDFRKDPAFVPKKGAAKFEDKGQLHVPSTLGMSAAVAFHETIGKRNVEARVRQLSAQLKEGLHAIPGVKLWTSMKPELTGGVTLFTVGDVPMDNVKAALIENEGIYIRTMYAGDFNAVRASTHIYNTPEEVDRLVAGVHYIMKHSSDYMTSPTTG